MDALAQRVEWARDAGLLVVLDMHQDIYGEGFGGDGAPLWTCDAAHYAAFKPADQWFFDYLSPEVIACVDGFYASSDLRAHYDASEIDALIREIARVNAANRIENARASLGSDRMIQPVSDSGV